MVFNAGSPISHGALGGDVPGLAFGASRLSSAIAGSLFAASPDLLRPSYTITTIAPEPTRYVLRR